MRSLFLDGHLPAPAKQMRLRAGDLTMVYESGMLRYICAGEIEVVRGIYAAVRDHNWGTVPFVLHDEEIDAHADSFTVRFISEHRQGDIHYLWRGTIIGTAEGQVTFTFDGEARSAFRRNRIGLCVLHPADAAGAPLIVEHTDGAAETGIFPAAITPHQPYFDIRSLTHQPAAGIQVRVVMEGDTFEMEDQRNWTDASFKTYCTPLARPFPVMVDPGDRVRQSVTVRLIAERTIPPARESSPVLALDADSAHLLPAIGLCHASHDEPLSERQIARLRALHLAHLRVEVRLDADDLESTLRACWGEAVMLGAQRLEIAALVDAAGDVSSQLNRLDDLLRRHSIAATVIVLEVGALVTSPAVIAHAATIFEGREPTVRFGAGTRGFFTQINRQPPTGNPPLIAYALTPQVHAFDNASLVETLPMLGETVRAARALSNAAVAVTPITFRIGWNPDATAEQTPPPPDRLPPQVDPRQMSLFGAGWTLGAIASLALADAASLTFYETTGWLGVMERERGAPLPDQFPSIAGGVYPMYHVFAALAQMGRTAQVLRFTPSRPLIASGLALRDGQRWCLLVANHTDRLQQVVIEGVDGVWRARTLDEAGIEMAVRDPEGFSRLYGEIHDAGSGSLPIEMPPYALIRLDQSSSVYIDN